MPRAGPDVPGPALRPIVHVMRASGARIALCRVGLAAGVRLGVAVVLGLLAPVDTLCVFGRFPPELLVLRVRPDVGDRLVLLTVCHARTLPVVGGRDTLPTLGAMADDDRPPLLVSACLLGVPCNHRGGASPSPEVAGLGGAHRLVPVCPEVAGGLPTPRIAAERQPDGRVLTAEGADVTDAYVRGADQAVALARAVGAQRAVLKARSPSCGCEGIYDGTFSRTLTPGEGVTAAALRAAGVEVRSEEELSPGLRAARGTGGSSAGGS